MQSIKKYIPIVMCSDKNYAVPMFVTFQSLMDSCKETTRYKFYFIVSGDFGSDVQQEMDRIIAERGMPTAEWIHADDRYDTINMQLKHITAATYYRLQLPSLIQEETCIYLDVDLCVCEDLSELFAIDMENYYIAGVKAAAYYHPEDKQAQKAEVLGIEAFDRYVNAGVLLVNLKKMREDGMEAVFEHLLAKEFQSQDQDILNSGCYPDIKIIPPKYNLMTKYSLNAEAYQEVPCLSLAYEEQEWMEAVEQPAVIHYADVRKPWLYLDSQKSDQWWKLASEVLSKQVNPVLLNQLYDFYRLSQDRHVLIEEKYIDEKNKLIDRLHEEFEKKAELSAKLRQTYDDRTQLKETLKQTFEEKSELGKRVRELEQQLGTVQRLNDQMSQTLEKRDAKIEKQAAKIEKQTAKIEKQTAKIEKQTASIERLTTKVENRDAKIEKLSAKVDTVKQNNATLREKIAGEKKKNAQLLKKYNDIRNSVSFKIGRILTAIPRKLKGLFKK